MTEVERVLVGSAEIKLVVENLAHDLQKNHHLKTDQNKLKEQGMQNSLLVCLSHNADCLISQSLTVPLLLLYANVLHSMGWNSAAVITSVSSSILAGLISTISDQVIKVWKQMKMCLLHTTRTFPEIVLHRKVCLAHTVVGENRNYFQYMQAISQNLELLNCFCTSWIVTFLL